MSDPNYCGEPTESFEGGRYTINRAKLLYDLGVITQTCCRQFETVTWQALKEEYQRCLSELETHVDEAVPVANDPPDVLAYVRVGDRPSFHREKMLAGVAMRVVALPLPITVTVVRELLQKCFPSGPFVIEEHE